MASNLQKFNQAITNAQWQDYLSSVLGEKKSSFVNNIVSLVANNKMLQDCEPSSLIYAGMKATALDLPLDANLGFAYVIPYKNNRDGKTEAQFQIGYKGLTQLAIRSGQYRTINVRDVRKGELAGEDFISGEMQFRMLPYEEREKAEIVGYVGYFKLNNGFEKMEYWSVERLREHGLRYSQTFSSRNEYVRNSSKWTTDFDAMAKKTVIKLLLSKYGPMSVEMIDAVKYDQSVITENGPKYVDNGKPSSEEQAADFIGECEVVSVETAGTNVSDVEPAGGLFDDNGEMMEG